MEIETNRQKYQQRVSAINPLNKKSLETLFHEVKKTLPHFKFDVDFDANYIFYVDIVTHQGIFIMMTIDQKYQLLLVKPVNEKSEWLFNTSKELIEKLKIIF